MHLQCPHCTTVLDVNSPAGTHVQCPSCQGVFAVPAAAPVSGPPQINITPGPKKKPASASPSGEATEAEGEETEEGKISWKTIEKSLYGAIGALFLAAAIFGIAIAWRMASTPGEDVVDNSQYVADGKANSGNQIQQVMQAAEKGEVFVNWINAEKSSGTMDGFKVKINHVDWGEVRGRDATGNLVTSERPMVNVYLELSNRSNSAVNFRSWYGTEFTTENGALRTAQLSDDNKAIYYPLRFDDLKQLKWWTPRKTFEPAEEGTDVIVFDVDENFDPASVQNLYLDLPGEAVGKSGSYRFQIPRSMIQGL